MRNINPFALLLGLIIEIVVAIFQIVRDVLRSKVFKIFLVAIAIVLVLLIVSTYFDSTTPTYTPRPPSLPVQKQ